MGNAGWFLLGAASVWLIGKGLQGGVRLSANVGAGRAGNRSYRGAQRPAAYEPLGTVGGFPEQDPGGWGGAIGFGGMADLAANPQGSQNQIPPSSNGAFDPKGLSIDGNSYCGCLTGAKA